MRWLTAHACTVSFTGKPVVQKHFKPSKHILSDAGNFAEKDLNGDHNYDSIMMRLEHMIIVSAADAGMSCLNVVKEFVECRRHAGTRNFFLATDARKFGSDAPQTLIGKKQSRSSCSHF